MQPGYSYTAYKWVMLHWYDFLRQTTKPRSITPLLLSIPAGLVSAASWTLLSVADLTESVAFCALNILTCHFREGACCLGRSILSALMVTTVPVIAPGLFIKSSLTIIFEEHRFAEKSYDLFHRDLYEL